MNIDVKINSRIPVKTTVQVDTDTVRIKGVYFDFNNDSSQLLVGFGQVVGADYNELKVEVWSISGEFYFSFLNRRKAKNILQDELEFFVSSLLTRIHTEPSLKERLIESRELVITPK